MRFWFDFFLDKRFSLDFKIANFIMRDSLRNYLACMLHECKNIKNSNSQLVQEKNASKIENKIRLLMNGNG
jgi:hypothetical protein